MICHKDPVPQTGLRGLAKAITAPAASPGYLVCLPSKIGSMERGKPEQSTVAPPVDYGAACLQLRAAIEPARAHAVSLHDRAGELLWLSESSMGPDEHDAVRRAFESYADPASPMAQSFDLGDDRSAVLFRLTNHVRVTVGAAMFVVDSRLVGFTGRGPEALMTPKLQRALIHAARMLGVSTQPNLPSTAPPQARGPAPPDTGGGVSSELDRFHAALRRTRLALYVQRLVPLHKGSPLKRFEVLLRLKSESAPNCAPQAMLKAAVENGLGSMIDRRVVSELVGWLKRHPRVWQDDGAMFSVNLTSTALQDEHFLKFVELCLAKAGLPKATIGFEISVPGALGLGARVAAVAAAFHRLECPLVLDDFDLRAESLELLRLPGVRLIKLATEITANMRTDKFAQAQISALVQMARVLGMHTVVKRTESAADQGWLVALGVDFLQSNAFSPSMPIDALTRDAAS